MNIFIIRFINAEHGTDYLSHFISYSLSAANSYAEGNINRWKDGTTFEIIEYTPLQK